MMINFLSAQSYRTSHKHPDINDSHVKQIRVVFINKIADLDTPSITEDDVNNGSIVTIDQKRYMFFCLKPTSIALDIQQRISSSSIINNLRACKHVFFIMMRTLPKYKQVVLFHVFQHLLHVPPTLDHTLSAATNTKFYIVDHSPSYTDAIRQIYAAHIARTIATIPANQAAPSDLAHYIANLFKGFNKEVRIRIFDHTKIRQLGLNLVYAVGKGSANPPHFVVIEKLPRKSDPVDICLVGKGVVFDSGGYQLKRSSHMESMKTDKTGAGMTVGLMQYIMTHPNAFQQTNVLAVIPIVENLISGTATMFGDVVRAYNGKTVEITDPDAEGRLVLADAFAYAGKKYKPKYVLDFATLTGWAHELHCDDHFAYFTLNEQLSQLVNTISTDMAERAIRIPPWKEYQTHLKSNIADFTNSGSEGCPNADGLMASLFMMQFLPKQCRQNWIHFDVAPTTAPSANPHTVPSFHTAIQLLHRLAHPSSKAF
jgi:leucyl aminopeptidase